jgi:nucleoside-diphosphate kinase
MERNMAGNQTLAIIKPDAVANGKLGAIAAHIEREGYRIRAARLIKLTRAQAEAFYEVHWGRPFYEELVTFMSSGPCFPMALERDGAVAAFRTTIGATDPAEAAVGTIRKLYAESKGRNAVHGSDSDENAAREIAFFWSEAERAGLV